MSSEPESQPAAAMPNTVPPPYPLLLLHNTLTRQPSVNTHTHTHISNYSKTMAHAYIQVKRVTDLLLKYNETMNCYRFYLYFEFVFIFIYSAFICSHTLVIIFFSFFICLSVLFYFILFYFILFYFILFYFIFFFFLFYFFILFFFFSKM